MALLLEIHGLEKTFCLHQLGGKRIAALTGIEGTLAEGEVLGLTGRSGSGKSTLMKCVYRTYLPTAGSIRYHAREGTVELASADEHTVLGLRRREITYCAQFLRVIPRVPAVEVAAEPLLNDGVERAEALARAREALDQLGLPRELWDAYPSTFSGGEQQRVNIARAAIAQPRLLLLDEPTASLDQAAKDAVIAMVRRLRQQGTGMLLITHDPYTLDRLADRRLQLHEGRLAEVLHA